MANLLDIDFQHHDAEQDALAAAKIVVAACKKIGVNSITKLAEKLEIENGSLFPGGYKAARSYPTRFLAKDIEPSTDKFDENHPLYKQSLVFTGTLTSMTRREAMQKVVDVGGLCTSGVVENTNYLIMGDQDFSKFTDGKKSSKTKRAELLISKEQQLEIISEDDFLRMLF